MSSSSWFEEVIHQKPESKVIDVDGAKIHYLFWGDRTKPGLFFVHGYAANAHWWDFIAPHFTDNYSVAAIDLSGMGDSEHRAVYSQEQYSREIKSVCDDLGWESASFLAHSMGGPITLKSVSLYPDLFHSLFLLDSVVVIPPDKIRSFSSKSMLRQQFHYDEYEEAINSFRLIPPQPCKNDYILRHIAMHSFKELESKWILKSDGMIMKTYETEDLTQTFMNLKCPLFIVYGLMSQIFSQELLEYTVYVGNVPDKRVVGITGAMHHLFIDEPLKCVEEIKRLLELGDV